MDLCEYEGKKLFEKYDISIPRSVLITKDNLYELDSKLKFIRDNNVVIKAQILTGGRMKAGAIKFSTKDKAQAEINDMLGKEFKGFKVNQILVEEMLSIKKERYVALTIDRTSKKILMICSPDGGIDIEELAKTKPGSICKLPFIEFDPNEIHKQLKFIECDELLPIIRKMLNLMRANDASLVQINPLVKVDDSDDWVAADAKVVIDDNALFRHPNFLECVANRSSGLEVEAANKGINYVELDGDVGVIGNGAGLVMATLDVLKEFGVTAANFLDIGGGADFEKVKSCLDIVLKHKDLKGLFINIFGGITRCDEVAKGIIEYKKNNNIDLPMVVRLIGTNEARAKELLESENIASIDSMEQGVEVLKNKIYSNEK